MERKLAEHFTKNLFELDQALNEIASLVENISEESEKVTFRRAIGELMGGIYTDMMVPIFRQYPDLDPERKPTST